VLPSPLMPKPHPQSAPLPLDRPAADTNPAVQSGALEEVPVVTSPHALGPHPRRRLWPRGGILLLLSLGFHGVLLGLPVPQPDHDQSDAAAANDQLDSDAVVTISALPSPEDVPSPPASPPPPAPAPVPPAPPAAVAPAPPMMPTPVRTPESAQASAPPPQAANTAAFTPTEVAASASDAGVKAPEPAAATPINLFGVPAPPGSQPIADPADWLPGDRLGLHQQDGALHADIVGQFVVEVAPGEDAEAWFRRHYQPLLQEHYGVRGEGAFVRAPKYSLSRDNRQRAAFITLEALPHTPHMLVTVWQRNPT